MRYLIIYFFVLISFKSFSQYITIKGNIQDSTGNAPKEITEITVIKLKDNSTIKKTKADLNGYFELKNIPSDTLQVIIQNAGFSDKLFYIVGNGIDSSFNLGYIKLELRIKALKEIVVKAYNSKFYYKHDTLEYSADSVKLKQNAYVVDLLKRLPGITINDQGQIFSQGKAIDKILIDGEEFFGNNLTIASENLPAKIVESVQVYQKKDDASLKPDSKLNLLNLKLKENAKNGLFGKIALAGDFNKYYETSSFINKFKGPEKISVFLGASNIANGIYEEINKFSQSTNNYNTTEFGDEESSSINMTKKGNEGISKILYTNIFYTNKLWKKDKLSVNYSFENNPTFLQSLQKIQYFTEENKSSANVYDLNKERENQAGTFKFTHKLNPSTEIEISPTFIHGTNTLNNNQETRFFKNTDSLVQVVKIENAGRSTSNMGNANLSVRKKFNKGRQFNCNLNYTQQLSSSYSVLKSTDGNDTINQEKNGSYDRQMKSISALYLAPLSKKINLLFYINSSWMNEMQNVQTLNFFDGSYSILDSSQTNKFDNKRINREANLKLNYESSHHQLEIGTSFRQIRNTNHNQMFNTQIHQSIDAFLPYCNYRYLINENSNIGFNYTTTVDQPAIEFLAPVKDNTNPNQVMVGNPGLLPSFTNNINLSYNIFNGKSNKNIWVNADFSSKRNDFTSYLIYDSIGRSTGKIINTNGNYLGNISFNASLPLFSKLITISPHLDLGYTNTINYVDSKRNISKKKSAITGLSIIMHLDTLVVSIKNNFYYSTSNSTINNQTAQPYFKQIYTLAIDYPFFKGFSIEGEATHTINSNRTTGFNKSYTILNAGIKKDLLKPHLTVSFLVHNLLNQSQNIERYITDISIVDTRTNIIKRFFLLRIVYQFDSFKSKK
jgi:hypothetical protein